MKSNTTKKAIKTIRNFQNAQIDSAQLIKIKGGIIIEEVAEV